MNHMIFNFFVFREDNGGQMAAIAGEGIKKRQTEKPAFLIAGIGFEPMTFGL